MAEDKSYNFGEGIEKLLTDMIVNSKTSKNGNDANKNINVNINQKVSGTDSVLAAAKANDAFVKSLGGVKKVTTELKQLLSFKSSSKEDALTKIANISEAYDKIDPGQLVRMVNAYRAQYDDWEKITEEFFAGITRIRDRYNKIVSSNLDKSGRQTYADENYSLSPQKIKAILDKYSDVQHPQLWLDFDLKLDEQTIIDEYTKRRDALIEKLNSLDKGKITNEYGLEEELLLDDNKELKEFVSFYSELESLVKDFGGDIPNRLKEMYSNIEKANEDGMLRINSAIQRGKNGYKDFISSLKEFGLVGDLTGFSEDAIDDLDKRISNLFDKINRLSRGFESAVTTGVKKSGEDESYYLGKINSLESMIETSQKLRSEIGDLQSQNLSEKETETLEGQLKYLTYVENAAREKAEEIKEIYNNIDFEAQRSSQDQLKRIADLKSQLRMKILSNGDFEQFGDLDILTEYINRIKDGYEDIELIYNDFTNRISQIKASSGGGNGAGADSDDGVGNSFSSVSENVDKLIEKLDKLISEIGEIRKAIGSVDDESGIGNLITQFNGLIQRISELQEAVGKINFNVVINDPSKDEEFWNKQLQRYRDYFQKAVKRLGGMDFAYNAIEQAGYAGDFVEISNRFNQAAMDNSNLKPEQIIQNYQEFFKYLKLAAKQMKDETGDYAEAVRESVKNLPTSDIKALIRNNQRAQAKDGASDKADAITQAINDALTGNKDKEDIDISKHLGDLTGVIDDLHKIQDILNEIANNKAISENIDRVMQKLEAMQQSFRDLLRNLNESVKQGQANLELGDGNLEIVQSNKVEESAESIKLLIEQFEKLNTEISAIRSAFGSIDEENGITSLLSQISSLSIKLDEIQTQFSQGLLATNTANQSIEAKFGDLSEVLSIVREIKEVIGSIGSNNEIPQMLDNIRGKLDSMQQSAHDLLNNLKESFDKLKIETPSTTSSEDNDKEQKLLSLLAELKEFVGNIEVMPSIPRPRDFIGKIDELLEGYFATVEIRPDFNAQTFINEVDRLVETEIQSFSELANYLSYSLPDAIQDKNNAFQGEVDVVSNAVKQEIEQIKRLETEIKVKVPEAISKKNQAFQDVGNIELSVDGLKGGELPILSQINELLQKGDELKSLASILSKSKEKIQSAKDTIDGNIDSNYANVLSSAISDAEENLAKEKAYLEERNRLLAEGTAQAKAYADEQKRLQAQEGKEKSNELKRVEKSYDEQIKNLKQINRLKIENIKLSESDKFSDKEKLVKNERDINDLLERNTQLEEQRTNAIIDSVKKHTELLEVQEKLNNSYNDAIVSSQASKKDSLIGDIDNYVKRIDNVIAKGGKAQSFIDEINKLKGSLEDIKKDNKIDLDFDQAKSEVISLGEAVEDALNPNNIKAQARATEQSITGVYAKIEKFARNNSALGKELKSDLDQLTIKIKDLLSSSADDNALRTELNSIKAELNRIEAAANEAGEAGKSFGRKIVDSLTNANARFIANYVSFQDLIRYIRTAYSTIKELDSALLDLKKTTTMNNSELEDFYRNSANVAKETGVETQEIISQAAAWSRLGYSSKDAAEEMARLSSQFAQISPGTSVENATDYLVSTMKAFHVDVADVEETIMSTINRIGNTMATSNQEVGEMLQRSSAAMSEANNTLAETIALESAAVQITRNAETTGTAFRTISMRIRGLDEETEEASEDFEELKGKIADLTKTASKPGGISLFTDASKTTYKSTYQLLKEISEIYDELTDKQQAGLLEALAGKRGGQVLAGILSDFSEVERAMGEIEKSSGSAAAEMEIVRETLAFKQNELKNTWIKVMQDLVDRGVIGDLIDLLTKLSSVIEKLVSNPVGLSTLVGSIVGLVTSIKKVDLLSESKSIFSDLFSSKAKLFSQEDIANIQTYIQKLQTAQISFDEYKQSMSQFTPIQQEVLNNNGLLNQGIAQSTANYKELTSSLNASTIATKAMTVATNALISIGISLAISAIIKGFDDLIHKEERIAENAQKAKDAIEDIQSSLKSNKELVKDVTDRYVELAESVENVGTAFQNQGGLSNDEYEEFLDISNQLADAFPDVVTGSTSTGDAIIYIGNSAEEATEKLAELIEKEETLSNIEIQKNLRTSFKANSFGISDFEGDLRTLFTKEGQQEYFMNFLAGRGKYIYAGTGSYISQLTKDIETAAENAGLNDLFDNISGAYNFSQLSEGEYREFIHQLSLLDENYTKYYEQTIDGMSTKFSQAQNDLLQYMVIDLSDSQKYINANNEDFQEIAASIISNLDFEELLSELPENIDKNEISQIADYVKQQYIDSLDSALSNLNDSDKEKVQDLFTQLLAPDASFTQKREALDELYRILGAETGNDIINAFTSGLEENENIIKQIYERYNFWRDDLILDPNEQNEVNDIYEYLRSLNPEDLNLLANAPAQALENAAALAQYLKEIKELNKAIVEEIKEADITDAVETFNTKLKPQFDELASAYTQIFHNDNGFQAGLDSIDIAWFAGLKAQFTDLQETLGEEFDASNINAFFDAIENGGDITEEVAHEAFNDLATAYFYAAKGLADLNEETANSIKQMMKQMGVVNADEIVDLALAYRQAANDLIDYDKALELEYQKIEEWGLGDYAQQLKDHTIDSVFGNVDMNKRTIINWNQQYLDQWETALKSWEIFDEFGNVIGTKYDEVKEAIEKGEQSIDTVSGASGAFFLEDQEIEVAFTPIMVDKTGGNPKFLDENTVNEYIQNIIEMADKAVSESGEEWSQEAVFEKAIELDARGMYVEGEDGGHEFVRGLIAAIGDEAIDVGALMHFSGDFGAIELAEQSAEEMEAVTEKLAESGREIESITQADIQAFIEEGVVSAQTAEQLQYYVAYKAAASNTLINEDVNINALYQLAQTAGMAAAEIAELKDIMDLFDQAASMESRSSAAASAMRQEANRRMENFKEQVQARFDAEFKIEYEIPKTGGGSGAGSAGKEAADEWKEAFDKELQNLEWLRDNGFINEAEFLSQYRLLYEKYFSDLDKYAQEFYENQRKYLEQLKSYYNDVLGAITSLLDDEIDKYNKLEEKEKKVFEEEKKQNDKKIKELNKQIKAIDKQIKAYQKQQDAIKNDKIKPLEDQIKAREKIVKTINDEIKAMQDANEKRKDAIDLQKLQYEMERAEHQRTLLQYVEGPEGKGQLVYRNDPNAVKQAQENLDEKKFELQIKSKQEEVELIEKEIEGLQGQIDAYNDEIAKIDDIIAGLERQKEGLNDQIEVLNDQNEALDESITKVEEYYNKIVEGLQKYKEQWEEISKIEGAAKNLDLISSMGYNPADILSLDQSTLESFKTNFLSILGDTYSENENMMKALQETAGQGIGSYLQATAQQVALLQGLDLTSINTGIESARQGVDTINEGFALTKELLTQILPAEVVQAFLGDDESILASGEMLNDALQEMGYETTEEALGNIASVKSSLDEAISKVEDLIAKLKEAESAGSGIASSMVSGHADGTVGNAFASGYNGLPSPEKNALRSEYGQPELTVYPNGTYEITTTPTLSSLPKGTVIFNEEQTERILKSSTGKGRAYASGLNNNNFKSLEDAMPEKASMFDKVARAIRNGFTPLNASMADISRNVQTIAQTVTNNMTTNAGMNFTMGDVNITCPGVTSEEVARNIGQQLNKEFFGMAQNAYQRAHRR